MWPEVESGFRVRSNQLTTTAPPQARPLTAMPPQLPSPVISSSTLWATGISLPLESPFPPFFFAHHLLASREWVIPAKPKPGRKPKKDLAPTPVQTSDVITYFLIHHQDCSTLFGLGARCQWSACPEQVFSSVGAFEARHPNFV
jgi:Minimal binding motif of Hap4 for binding to Hap2/3/5